MLRMFAIVRMQVYGLPLSLSSERPRKCTHDYAPLASGCAPGPLPPTNVVRLRFSTRLQTYDVPGENTHTHTHLCLGSCTGSLYIWSECSHSCSADVHIE